MGRSAARKGDDPCVGVSRAQPGNNFCDGFETPTFKFRSRQYAGPGIENLHHFDARIELPRKIDDRRIDQLVDQELKRGWVAIGEETGRRLIGRALSGDHIARHRPGSPAETDEGGL